MIVNNGLCFSDLHGGAGKKNRFDILIDVLRSYGSDYETLILLGDILDEIRSPSGYYAFEQLAKVWQVIQHKFNNVIICAGNHDPIWTMFPKTMETFAGYTNTASSLDCHITVYGSTGAAITIGDKNVRILHGDVFDQAWSKTKDVVSAYLRTEGYINRWLMRNRMKPLSYYTAKAGHKLGETYIEKIVDYAMETFHVEDHIIMGHMHRQGIHERGDRNLICIGDWFEHRTYAEITNGQLLLKEVK